MTSADKIAVWRYAHEGTALTNSVLMDVLGERGLSGVDLSGANLSGANLYWANLYGANLRRANLSGANLSVANLSGANLSEANLSGANLFGANLRKATLYGVYGANLRRANLSGADLSGADLYRADLTGADLYRADLTGANLRRADLAGANVHQTGLLTLNTPSGQVRVFPLEGRWEICIGCWRGDLDGLNGIISDRSRWPQAQGEERELHRPILAALHSLISAHIAYPASEKLRASTEPAKEKETS